MTALATNTSVPTTSAPLNPEKAAMCVAMDTPQSIVQLSAAKNTSLTPYYAKWAGFFTGHGFKVTYMYVPPSWVVSTSGVAYYGVLESLSVETKHVTFDVRIIARTYNDIPQAALKTAELRNLAHPLLFVALEECGDNEVGPVIGYLMHRVRFEDGGLAVGCSRAGISVTRGKPMPYWVGQEAYTRDNKRFPPYAFTKLDEWCVGVKETNKASAGNKAQLTPYAYTKLDEWCAGAM